MYITIPPLQSQYFVEPPFEGITAASLLWYVSISLAHLATFIFAHSSRQNCSSSFKLDGFRWYTAIFKSFHWFSIGLRSGLWLVHFKTFKCFPLNHLSDALAVCLGSLSCWKVNLRPSLKSLEDKQVFWPLFFKAQLCGVYGLEWSYGQILYSPPWNFATPWGLSLVSLFATLINALFAWTGGGPLLAGLLWCHILSIF